MLYYAHSLENASEDKWQPLREHLENTGEMAAEFAKSIGAESFALTAGLLHDIGKYSEEFQERLRGSSHRVDHSTAGAQEVVRQYGKAIGRLIAYVVSGHHTGLPDYGSLADEDSLCKRLQKKVPEYYHAYANEQLAFPSELSLPIHPLETNPGFSLQFFIRIIYSCLVDSDFLDTEAVLDPQRASARGNYPKVGELLARLDLYMDELSRQAPVTAVNQWRQRILKCCQEKAHCSPGLFTLTVPTGGGKTLSSLSFALRHIMKHRMERVIYIIPYTSIIEQNASVFRRILGDSCVLEHHSNFQFTDIGDETWTSQQYRLRLSSENWDAPIIVSTNVQFFESLFSSRSSRCRKIHNIANSVIILDEAQMLPTSYLKPCLLALAELVKNYKVSMVLCTATQPAIKELFPETFFPIELAPEPRMLYEEFRRVQVIQLGDVDDEELSNMIEEEEQALCIVNTRSHALKLYNHLKGEGRFHLSARMYPIHRSQKLKEIRKTLAAGKQCRVISTQLIEAGVDVDFPVVYRAISGIDSIAQAAGRCNREGRLLSGKVYLFRPERHGQPRGWFSRTAKVAEMVMRNNEEPLSLESVDQYFTLLYDIEGKRLDEKEIIQQFEEGASRLAFPFRKVNAEFNIIEANMVPIIIPRDSECIRLLEEARWKGSSIRLSRVFQRYMIQIYESEFTELLKLNALETIAEQYIVLKDINMYCEETGLTLSNSVSVDDILIF